MILALRIGFTVLAAGMDGVIFFVVLQDGVYQPYVGLGCAAVLALLANAWRKC